MVLRCFHLRPSFSSEKLISKSIDQPTMHANGWLGMQDVAALPLFMLFILTYATTKCIWEKKQKSFLISHLRSYKIFLTVFFLPFFFSTQLYGHKNYETFIKGRNAYNQPTKNVQWTRREGGEGEHLDNGQYKPPPTNTYT